MIGKALVRAAEVIVFTPISAASHTDLMAGWLSLVLLYKSETMTYVELTSGSLATRVTTF